MSDTQLRFKQLGGSIDFTVPVADMADYPVEQEVVLERQIDTTWGGKTYTYQRFTKKRWSIHFNDISDTSCATLGSIAQQAFDFALYYGTDVANSVGLYATCFFPSASWYPRETAYGLWTVDFIAEQVIGQGLSEEGTTLVLKHYNGTAAIAAVEVTFAAVADSFEIKNVDINGNGILYASFDGGVNYTQIIGYGAQQPAGPGIAQASIFLRGTTVPYEIITHE